MVMEKTPEIGFSWQIDFHRAATVARELEIDAGIVRGIDSDVVGRFPDLASAFAERQKYHGEADAESSRGQFN